MIDYTEMNEPELLKECGIDARKWAAAFRQTALKLGYSDMDEGWLIGWFANPMMQMHDQMMRPIIYNTFANHSPDQTAEVEKDEKPL